MGVLADILTFKKREPSPALREVDRSIEAVVEARKENAAAAQRLDRLMNKFERTIDRTLEQNARATGRKRHGKTS